MKVLQLYNVFGATTERTLLAVPEALSERGVEVAVAYESMSPEAPALGWPMQQVSRIAVSSATDVAGQMEAVAAQEPAVPGAFDLVHGHFGPRVLHGSRYLRRGVPLLISCYGYDVSRLLRDPCWGARYAWAGARGAVFVALSTSMKQTLVDCGVPEAKVRIIRLGIDLADWPFLADGQPARSDAAAPRFVFIGRLTGKKAPHDAIAALPPDATLDIIGKGELEDSLRAQVAANASLLRRVRFLGQLPLDELPAVMRGATGFVLPSVVASDGDMEGMPMILMQSLALGLPCITTQHAGNAEVIPPEDRAACVVPESDVPALRSAMERLMTLPGDHRDAMRLRGRAWIEAGFNLRQAADAYFSVYQELAAG